MRRRMVAMWTGLIIVAQAFGPPAPDGGQDLTRCTREQNITREERRAACYRVTTGKEVLDKKRLAGAYATLAALASGDGDRAAAIHNYDRAIALNPDQPNYYGLRGFEYHLLGDYDRAFRIRQEFGSPAR